MTAPSEPKFDLDYRPASYTDAADPVAAVLQNVKGHVRRQMIRDFVSGTAPARLGEIDPALLTPAVDEPTRVRLGQVHPSWMGGEYLPDYGKGEIEIARIVLASVTQDVFSIRAKATKRGYRYRMVDEYDSTFDIRPRTSRRPLTMRRLIALIDGAESDELEMDGDLIHTLQTGAEGLPDAAGFVTVESDVYPQLGAWYAWREEEELALIEAEREAEEGAEE